MDEKTIKEKSDEFKKDRVNIDKSKVIYMYMERSGELGKLEIGFRGTPLYINKDIESIEQTFSKIKEQLVWQKDKEFVDYTTESFELIIDVADLEFVALLENGNGWLLKIGLGARYIEFKNEYNALRPLRNRLKNALKQKMQ